MMVELIHDYKTVGLKYPYCIWCRIMWKGPSVFWIVSIAAWLSNVYHENAKQVKSPAM